MKKNFWKCWRRIPLYLFLLAFTSLIEDSLRSWSFLISLNSSRSPATPTWRVRVITGLNGIHSLVKFDEKYRNRNVASLPNAHVYLPHRGSEPTEPVSAYVHTGLPNNSSRKRSWGGSLYAFILRYSTHARYDITSRKMRRRSHKRERTWIIWTVSRLNQRCSTKLTTNLLEIHHECSQCFSWQRLNLRV